ncbi:MAG: NAD(P)-dependent oxidoreductase [Nitrososphaerales archaeon]
MKFLVTGASGFIGSALVQHLVINGHAVTCLIRDANKMTKFKQNMDFIVADITDREKVLQSLSNINVDVIFHLAAINPLVKDKKLRRRVNVDGVRNVIDACLNGNVGSFVYAQGTGVYGDPKGKWIDESTPKNPDTDFARTRNEAEEMLWQAMKRNALNVSVVVLGDVYGPGGWFADIIVNRIRNGSFKIPGSGEYYRSFVHVDDVANALALIAEKNVKNTTLIIADDEPTPFAEFIYYTADRLGLKRPGKVPTLLAKAVLGSDMVKLLTYSVRVRNTKMKKELGLQLQYPTYKEGVVDALKRL